MADIKQITIGNTTYNIEPVTSYYKVGCSNFEMNSGGSLKGYGGFIDFHFFNSSGQPLNSSGSVVSSTPDYTSRIIEDSAGCIDINGTYIAWTGLTSSYIKSNGSIDAMTFNENGIALANKYVTTDTTQTISGLKTFKGNESNDISFVYNGNSTISGYGRYTAIRHALSFPWYNDIYQIGNIRGDSADSLGFGITKGNSELVARFVDTSTAYIGNNTIIHSGNIGSQSVNYANSAGSANSVAWGNVSGKPFKGTSFVSGDSGNGEHNANNTIENGHYYYTSNGPATSLGASTTDGALYVQSYSSSWVGQIAQDYRNGSLFVRGKNNGSWSSWKRIIDSDNIGSQAVNYANFAGYASYLSNVASVNGNNTARYPWRRIMSIPATTNNYYDTVGTYYLSGNYHSAPYYLFRVEFRTNNSSAGDPGGFAISVIATNSDPNNLAIASYSVATNGITTNYSDIFIKTDYGWPRMTLTRLSPQDYGSITYYNSDEGYDASSRIAAYIGINGSGVGYASYELHSLTAYTSVIYGKLTASVSYASNAGWAKANDVYDWAKASSKPSYTKSEVGLGNVDNTADVNKNVNYATSSHLLRTYSAGNGSHGADYYLKCRHNVDGNDRFKLQIVRSDGSVTHSTSVDFATSAGSVAWGNIGGKPSTFPATVDSSLSSSSSNPVKNSIIYSAFSCVVGFDHDKYTYGDNGSWRLQEYHATSNTLDIRYGRIAIDAQEKTYDVSFSKPMGGSNYAIVFGIYRSNRNSWFWSPLAKNRTTSGFTVYVRGNTSGDNSGTLMYIAIKSN